MIKMLLKEELDNDEFKIEVINNQFFDGSIKFSRLLLVEGMINHQTLLTIKKRI